MFQTIFFGLMTGSILAVAATGFAMIRQTEGFLNILHGQFIFLGAIIGYVMIGYFGQPVLIAGLLAVFLVGIVGVVVSHLFFAPMRDKGHSSQFFTSIGLAFVFYGLINAGWSGAAIKIYNVDFGSLLRLGPVSVTVGELLIVAVAWSAILALHLFLTYSAMGIGIRAIAANAKLAQLRGIRANAVLSAVWFIASGLGALAGVLIGLLESVHTELGWHYTLLVLAVSVVGGVRNLYGVMVAGLMLGLCFDLSSLIIPSKYGLLLAFGAIIATLSFRPEGLFSAQRRREV